MKEQFSQEGYDDRDDIHDDILARTSALLTAIGEPGDRPLQSDALNSVEKREADSSKDKLTAEQSSKVNEQAELKGNSRVFSQPKISVELLSVYQRKSRIFIYLALFLAFLSFIEAAGLLILFKKNEARFQYIENLVNKNTLEGKRFFDKWKKNGESLQSFSDKISEKLSLGSEKIDHLDRSVKELELRGSSFFTQLEQFEKSADRFSAIAAIQRFELSKALYFSTGDKMQALSEIDKIESEIVNNNSNEGIHLKKLIIDDRQKLLANKAPNLEQGIQALNIIEKSILALSFRSSNLFASEVVTSPISSKDVSVAFSEDKLLTDASNVDQVEKNIAKDIDSLKNFQSNFRDYLSNIKHEFSKELTTKWRRFISQIIEVHKIDEEKKSHLYFSVDGEIEIRNRIQLHFAKARLSIMLQNKILIDRELKEIISLIRQYFYESPQVLSVIESLHSLSDLVPNHLFLLN